MITTMKNKSPISCWWNLETRTDSFLSVAGISVRMVDYSQRAEELEIVVNKAKEKKNPVLMWQTAITCGGRRRRQAGICKWLTIFFHRVDSSDTRHAVKASLRNTQTEDMHMNLQKII